MRRYFSQWFIKPNSHVRDEHTAQGTGHQSQEETGPWPSWNITPHTGHPPLYVYLQGPKEIHALISQVYRKT